MINCSVVYSAVCLTYLAKIPREEILYVNPSASYPAIGPSVLLLMTKGKSFLQQSHHFLASGKNRERAV